jgi:brefeldin A-resistance guanine nucleotide exchange factor 1
MMKVIKGEIHNVWVVMRVAHSSEHARRFTEEVVLDEHPLFMKLKELHEVLSDYEQQQTDNKIPIEGVSFFLTPFCQAVMQADINASITGAALSALHKFLLYGFLNESSSEGMKMIAESIMKCTFEETQNTPSSRLMHLPSTLHSSSSSVAADEQVVLKLLNLGSLVVQSSIQQQQQQSADSMPVLNTELVVGILNTCLHVSHRAKHASLLLKSAAADALGQIVLCVFYNSDLEEWKEARTTILQQLSSLCDPQEHDDTTCITSLSLLNIALETMPFNSASSKDVEILQNDLCKHLLRLSTTQDLVILNLTLRVIFNLFQSIRNHLKVPLEIFLTSVHVRILESKQSSEEQREVVLESLLEFCREPALMQDLYLNYDCDVQCTNLFNVIATSLSRMAGDPQDDATKPLNVLNRLALEGILYVIDSIARRCRAPGDITTGIASTTTTRPRITRSQSSFVSVEDLHSETSSHRGDNFNESYDDLSDRWKAEETHKVLQEQKRRKDLLEQATAEFNRPHPDFVEILQDLELTSTPASPEQVANFLYTTPHLDKILIGLYLSKGPAEDYPFHEQVRKAFVGLFDFSGKGFAEALRKLLSRFRLPGEAQCIDRLMEAFAQELYRQQLSDRLTEDLLKVEGDGDEIKMEHEDKDTSHPFKSADAVFTLAFSTILLNTDLHNPTIKDEKRMTLEQFIRNNRGINDGEDFPEEFLTELYSQIKSQEIQVRKEVIDLVRRHAMEDYDGEFPAKHWAVVLSSKTRDVAKPFFTPVDEARRSDFQAGIHDKDMFLSISESAIHCVSSIFVRSSDDALVLKALKGFKQMAQICVYFDLDEPFDKILKILLGHGRDYVMSCIALEYAGYDGEQIMSSENSQSVYSRERQVPPSIVSTLPTTIDQQAEGSATHRGFLSLDCAFALICKHPSKIREAWPTLIECLCALRDARALPDRVIFLDDFADSQGNLLPLSSFARQSQKRLDGYYRSLSEGDHKKASESWLSSVFKTKETCPYDVVGYDGGESSSSDRGLSSYSQSLLEVTRRARLEEVVLMRPKNLPMAKQTISALLDAIDVYPYFDDPVFEQHAVYSLELALLALISNRDRAGELFPLFLPKFETVLKSRTEDMQDVDPNIPTQFLMERVVVTILRSSIHLYEEPEVCL